MPKEKKESLQSKKRMKNLRNGNSPDVPPTKQKEGRAFLAKLKPEEGRVVHVG